MPLALRDLRVRYGPITAVAGATLSIAPGEVVSVIGPNGAGKSSLLAGIMGLATHEGAILLDGRDLSLLDTASRCRCGLGYVPTGRGVFGTLTVRENVEVACERDADATWQRLAAWFPVLRDKEQALASMLSGGQRQIVSIARAMARSPRLVLLDEPSMGLSPIAIGQLRDVVRQLTGQGVGILLAEQNASLALSISDRCHLLVRGEMRLSGTPAELRDRPEVEALYLGRTIQ